MMDKNLLLNVQDLSVNFSVKDNRKWPWSKPDTLHAVNGVNIKLYEGETLGIVGESGCGKSTLARAVIGLVKANDGKALWLGQDLTKLDRQSWQEKRKDIQMIFQDPLASLNPRMTIGKIIAEPLNTYYPSMNKEAVREKVKVIMEKVGLLHNMINRYPHEFSGGQCQRIGIARALILEPKLVICDEPVSALDVSVQAQVVNLLKALQKEMGLSLIFIAHDLAIVKYISDRILVMYLGNPVEEGQVDDLFNHPQHPYTQALLSAVPVPDPDIEKNKTLQILEGDLPSPINPPSGCAFRTRCPKSSSACSQIKPEFKALKESTSNKSHKVACHLMVT